MDKIYCVDASDFPKDVLYYCVDNDISTHHQNDVIGINDDGNILSEWLKKNGFDFEGKDYSYIAIFAT